MSFSTKFVPKLNQTSGPIWWRWQNKINTAQFTDSFSTSQALEASGPGGRWWRWQNKISTTQLQAPVSSSQFSTSQTVDRMFDSHIMANYIAAAEEQQHRIPSILKIDEPLALSEFTDSSSQLQFATEDWSQHIMNHGCLMSWHSRQTSKGQMLMDKPSILLFQTKELRCLRNKIHTQLMITYTVAAILWIITNFTTTSMKGSVSSHVSCVTFILLHYFHLTSFFWMLVEGLYLYVLVVQTFQSNSEILRLRVYSAIGWGIPLLIVIGWSIVKWQTQPTFHGPHHISDIDYNMSCGIIAENYYDWIYKIPVILILCTNVVFLLRIMWVLITKLRSSTNPETKQSRKAAKAFVVLVPLLGITYIFILAGPRKVPTFEYFRALLISIQGFLVALFYCFLNGEVRNAVKHRWNRSSCCRRCFEKCFCCCLGPNVRRRQQVHEWSSRSRAENSRLYNSTSNNFRKRESTASETTTMTSLQGSIAANGSYSLRDSVGSAKMVTLQCTNPLLNKQVNENNNPERRAVYLT